MEDEEYEHVPNVMFYPYGIGSDNSGNIKTLKTLLRQFKDENVSQRSK